MARIFIFCLWVFILVSTVSSSLNYCQKCVKQDKIFLIQRGYEFFCVTVEEMEEMSFIMYFSTPQSCGNADMVIQRKGSSMNKVFFRFGDPQLINSSQRFATRPRTIPKLTMTTTASTSTTSMSTTTTTERPTMDPTTINTTSKPIRLAISTTTPKIRTTTTTLTTTTFSPTSRITSTMRSVTASTTTPALRLTNPSTQVTTKIPTATTSSPTRTITMRHITTSTITPAIRLTTLPTQVTTIMTTPTSSNPTTTITTTTTTISPTTSLSPIISSTPLPTTSRTKIITTTTATPTPTTSLTPIISSTPLPTTARRVVKTTRPKRKSTQKPSFSSTWSKITKSTTTTPQPTTTTINFQIPKKAFKSFCLSYLWVSKLIVSPNVHNNNTKLSLELWNHNNPILMYNYKCSVKKFERRLQKAQQKQKMRMIDQAYAEFCRSYRLGLQLVHTNPVFQNITEWVYDNPTHDQSLKCRFLNHHFKRMQHLAI